MSDEIAVAAEVELPLETVGSQLRRARETAGLSLAQVAAETRIGERQLKAIEDSNYAALPGRTYAVGFSRTYAKMLGLDATEVTEAVRRELADQAPAEPRRPVQTFEPGDPARVPSARLAWVAAGAIAAVIFGALVVWPSIFSPSGQLNSIVADEPPAPAASQAAAAPAPAANGPVVFTALDAAVWVKFTDAAGNQLFQDELAKGETYSVPTDKGDVFLRTARPEALAISVGGQNVAKISEVQQTVSQVPVSAAALLARGTAAATPAPSASAGPVVPNSASAPRQQSQRSAPQRDRQRVERPRVEASPAPADLPGAAAPAIPAPTPVPAPSAT